MWWAVVGNERKTPMEQTNITNEQLLYGITGIPSGCTRKTGQFLIRLTCGVHATDRETPVFYMEVYEYIDGGNRYTETRKELYVERDREEPILHFIDHIVEEIESYGYVIAERGNFIPDDCVINADLISDVDTQLEEDEEVDC